MTAPMSVRQQLVELASWGLPGSKGLTSPPDEPNAQALVVWADAQRLLGPLSMAVEHGAIQLPDEARVTLVARHEAALWWCLMVERRVLELQTSFAAAGGVEHLVVKGAAVAHLDEGDPSLRSFGDLDLLVRAEHLERAVAALEADGAARPWAERRAGFDRRFAKSVTLTGRDGIELDLHRSLCDGAHGFRIPLERLFAHQVPFRLGEVEVATLSPIHRFLHGAYHAVLGSPVPKLMSLRDLGGYLTRADLPVDEVVDEVRRWRGEAVLATAVRETLDTLDAVAPDWARWLAQTNIDRREQAIVDRQRAEGSTPGRAKLDGLAELSARDQAAYLLALAVPSRHHLHSRGLTLGAIYRRQLQPRQGNR